MTARTPVECRRAFRIAGALVGLSVALGACTHTDEVVTTASIPDDYRLRHPIAIQEANRSIVIFVGHARGGLSAEQRADVVGLAQIWLHEGTGAIVADVPVGTPNARAAAESFREARALLEAAGVPSGQSTPAGYGAADLSENYGGGRPLRPMARGSWSFDQGQRLYRKQAILQFRLRISAQHGCDGGESVRSAAAAS